MKKPNKMLRFKQPTEKQRKFCPKAYKGTENEALPENWHHMVICNQAKNIKFPACSIARNLIIHTNNLWPRREFSDLPEDIQCKECKHHYLTGGVYVKKLI